MSQVLLCLALACGGGLTIACGGSSTSSDPPDGPRSPDGPGTDAPGIDAVGPDSAPSDAAGSECSPTGNQFSVAGYATATSSAATLIGTSVIGATGPMTLGNYFLIRRDGDFGDGDLEEIRTYDVSAYPYNFLYQEDSVSDVCSDGGVDCDSIIATAGTFTVTALNPTFRATFNFTALAEGDSPGGTSIPGSLQGCLAVPR